MKYEIKKNTHYDFDITNACSSQDCTGLIPALPRSEAEFEAYNDIVIFEPPVVYCENDKKK